MPAVEKYFEFWRRVKPQMHAKRHRDTVPNRLALANTHFDAYDLPDGASVYALSGDDGEWDRSNPDLFLRTVDVWFDDNDPWDDPARVEFSVRFYADGTVAEITAQQGTRAFGKPGEPMMPETSDAPGNPDQHIVWEGGKDVAICDERESAIRVARGLRLAGSLENLWITKGAELEFVYDDPEPQTPVQSP